MTESGKELRRRDWILLPLLALITIVVLLCSIELIARLGFDRSGTFGEACMVPNRSSNSMGGIPNSICWEKIPEGKLIEYRMNSSGYRSDKDFGPKSPGTFRIVLIGSSFAVGARVPIEKAFATMLSPELSRLTGQKVEIINEAMAGAAAYPSLVNLRFKDALAAKPDMILQIVAPWDIQMETASVPTAQDASLPAHGSRLANFISTFRDSLRAEVMLRHILYESQSQYVKSMLTGDDSTDGFLRAEPSAEWKKRLLLFGRDDADVQERVKAAGIPLVSVLIPERVQAAMISMGEWPPEFDPFKLDNELRSIVTGDGGIYVDMLPDFRNIPNAEQGYYPVEGHLNVQGNAMISALLAKALTSGAVPALRVSTQSQIAQEYGK